MLTLLFKVPQCERESFVTRYFVAQLKKKNVYCCSVVLSVHPFVTGYVL